MVFIRNGEDFNLWARNYLLLLLLGPRFSLNILNWNISEAVPLEIIILSDHLFSLICTICMYICSAINKNRWKAKSKPPNKQIQFLARSCCLSIQKYTYGRCRYSCLSVLLGACAKACAAICFCFWAQRADNFDECLLFIQFFFLCFYYYYHHEQQQL